MLKPWTFHSSSSLELLFQCFKKHILVSEALLPNGLFNIVMTACSSMYTPLKNLYNYFFSWIYLTSVLLQTWFGALYFSGNKLLPSEGLSISIKTPFSVIQKFQPISPLCPPLSITSWDHSSWDHSLFNLWKFHDFFHFDDTIYIEHIPIHLSSTYQNV